MRIQIKFHTIHPLDTEPVSSIHGWARLVFFMMLGSFFGRTFYYLGFPPAKIFIGDVVIFLFFLLRPRALCDRWMNALTAGGPFGLFAWSLLLSILFGIFEVLYGLYSGYPPLTALQNLVFNIYPVYFFLGLWVGIEHPSLYRKIIRCYAWMLAIYGPAYLLFLDKIKLTMPASDHVLIFNQAGGGGFIILSLLALERKPSRYWLPMVIGAFMTLAIQEREEWVSAAVAFSVWGILERKTAKVLTVGALVVILLLVGFIADVDLPGPAERGGRISSSEIAARGLSAISPDLAKEYTDSKNIGMYAGTISWRTKWWSAIWSSVHESVPKAFIGNGYGFPLKDLVPYLKSMDIRTPHSIFFFALGYSGWIGVLLFFSLQASILAMLWRVYRLTGQSYGLAIWISTLTAALFGNSFESPMGSIPNYISIGLIIGPILCGKITILERSSHQLTLDQPLAAQRAYSSFSSGISAS
jgi:hypothetical protein